MPNSSRAPLSSTGEIRSCNIGMPFIRSHPMATAVPKIDLPDAVRCADRSLACVLHCDYLRWRIKPILTMPLKTGNATPAQFQKTVAFCNCSSHRLSHSALHRFSWMRMHLLMAFPAPARICAAKSTSSPANQRANLLLDKSRRCRSPRCVQRLSIISENLRRDSNSGDHRPGNNL